MADKIVVVDDFCDYPEQLARSVHIAGFGTWKPSTKEEVGTSVYEGMGFWGSHALPLRSLIEALGVVIVPNTMFFRNTNVGMEKAYIHSDRESGAHTCILYLSDHEQPSGTAFFKHIPTGLTEMPTFEEMKDRGIFEQLKKDMVDRNPAHWEQVGYVEGKFNRAVIFEAPLFHSRFPLEGIGNDPDEGRLIWASHFYKLHGDGTLF